MFFLMQCFLAQAILLSKRRSQQSSMAIDLDDPELTQAMIASLGEKAAWLERWSWRGWQETQALKRQVNEVKNLLEVVIRQMDMLEEKLTQPKGPGNESTNKRRPATNDDMEQKATPWTWTKRRRASNDEMQQKELEGVATSSRRG